MQGCIEPMGDYPSIFPTPGGGMSLARIPELLDLYGNDVLFLVGGSLYSRSADLVENAKHFMSLVGR
jgi:ribulose-bisphosphate carboxylase large chain